MTFQKPGHLEDCEPRLTICTEIAKENGLHSDITYNARLRVTI